MFFQARFPLDKGLKILRQVCFMGKKILAAASFEKQKYFFEPGFNEMPQSIKQEVRILCVSAAEKLLCTFSIGFYEDSEVFFEVLKPEDSIDFDDIGAELEIKEIQRKEREFLKALSLWHSIFKTEKGKFIKDKLDNFK